MLILTRKPQESVMIGGDDIRRLYGGLDSVPTTLIIDKLGRIAFVVLRLNPAEKSRSQTGRQSV